MKRGQSHPMFPGTWSVGHRPLTREAWWMAGVLSAGDGALLTGAAACPLYRSLNRKVGRVHVVRRGRAAAHGRLRIHTTGQMPPLRRRHGIPVVPVEDALLGLAADTAVADRDVRRALRQAQVDRLTTHAKLLAAARRLGSAAASTASAVSSAPGRPPPAARWRTTRSSCCADTGCTRR